MPTPQRPHPAHPLAQLIRCTLLLLTLSLLAGKLAAQNNQAIPVLEPGKPIERELVGGQAHSYSITLTAGQYLRVVVDQRGIDVVVTLLGPDSKQVATIDSPNGAQGPEPLSLVAEATGRYRLEIHSLEQAAAAGRYEVRLEERRRVTAREKRKLAENFQAEAERLAAPNTPDAISGALPLYEQALRLWQATGDVPKQVNVLNILGNIYRTFNIAGEAEDYRTALDYLERGLRLATASHDLYGRARSLYNIGDLQSIKGNQQLALDYLNQALSLLRTTKDFAHQVIVLNDIGDAYDTLEEPQKAINFYTEALRLAQAAQVQEGLPALENLARTYAGLEDRERALYYADALLAHYSAARRPPPHTTLINLSVIYNTFGEWQKALSYADEARAQAHSIRAPFSESAALTQIGIAQRELGNRQQAIASFMQAASISQELNQSWRRAYALYQMGLTYSNAGEQVKAFDAYQESLQIFRPLNAKSIEARVQAGIARVERARGHLTEAVAHIEAALRFVELFRTKLASPDLRAAFFASVADDYEFYIDLLMRLHARNPTQGYDAQALRASETARARSLLELLAESRADIRRGVDPKLVKRERSLQQQLNAKAKQQIEQLSEEQARTIAGEIAALTTEYQQVESAIRQQSPRYAALTQPQPLSLPEIQAQVLDSDTLLLEYSLGTDRSYLWAVTPTSFTSYELPKRAEIETAAREFYTFVHASPQPASTTTAKVGIGGELQRQAQARGTAAAAQLSRLLLAPAAALLGKKRLLIVADGALQYIPFAALPVPTDATSNGAPPPLVVEHEIVSLPSASTLAVLRREAGERRVATKTLAVLADPVFERTDERFKPGAANRLAPPPAPRDGTRGLSLGVLKSAQESGVAAGALGIPRLLFTRREAEEISKLAPFAARREALDFAANRTAATDPALAAYRFVHFATHGLLDSQHPELSGILLSMFDARGTPQDGFLRAHEIFNLKLNADLVVLSACQTGLGKEIRGEGLVGLTRGFMYAGVPRVVVSLWSVNDAATAALMTRFYRGMLVDKLRPAQALQAAQVSMLKEQRYSAPFYWAAFTLQGEWR